MSIIGNKAPDFSADAAKDGEIVNVSLSDYAGKWLILFFYPLDFTFVCPTEITAFSDRYEEFAKMNTEVLGVSVDSQFSHLAWIQTERNAGGLGDLLGHPGEVQDPVFDLVQRVDPRLNGQLAQRGVGFHDLELDRKSTRLNSSH